MSALHECDLTIIIPVYNLERFLQPMIESLKAQQTTYTFEILWVLNNCTDRSEDIIRESGLGKILYCTVQGCGAARNTGLDEATGSYIWFMDGDDYLLTDTAIQTAMDTAKGNLVTRVPFKSNAFNREYFSMVWQYIIKREFLNGIRFPHIQPCEDDAFTERVLNKLGLTRHTYFSLPSVKQPLYFYNYLREGSNMYRYLILREDINR